MLFYYKATWGTQHLNAKAYGCWYCWCSAQLSSLYIFFILQGDMILQWMVEMAINFLAPFSNFKPHLFQNQLL